jgi:DNA primase
MSSWKFPDDFLNEVRSRARVSDVVGAAVPLKRSGKTLKGLCPFHSEKTPSFHVDDNRGLFHCFGCGVGGDVFKFLMLHERLSFPEAVKQLAATVGVPLPASFKSEGDDRRARLIQVNQAALSYFRQQLASGAGSQARQYLARRGLEPSTVDSFELGLAQDAWDGLSRALRRRDIGDEELVAAGLCVQRPRSPGVYDRFRGRVMFPIRSASGTLLGFGGRALGSVEPKYLNSPETELYAKSELLFGLNRARQAIRERERGLLVEGYMDVIMLHQAGFEEAVATLGTSLTPGHARLIRRHAQQVLLCYDADPAGIAAARRALAVLLPAGLEARVVCLDGGLDPDDYVRAHGADGLSAKLEEAQGFVDFLAGPSPPVQIEGRIKLADEVIELVKLVPDSIARRLHAARLAERLGVEDAVVLNRLRAGAAARGGEQQATEQRPQARSDERRLLKALLSGRPWCAELAAGLEEEFLADRLLGPALLHLSRRYRDGGGSISGMDAGLEQALDPQLAGAVRELLLDDTGTPEPSEQEAAEALRTMKARFLQSQLEQVQAELRRGTPEQAALLLRKQKLARELDDLRKAGNLTET